VNRRTRSLSFGSAAALAVAGTLCLVLVGGLTGEVLAIILLSLGFGGAVLLAFLEVGLSEDRARAREDARRRRPPAGPGPPGRPRFRGRPRRPG
jgi:hypothetical protein